GGEGGVGGREPGQRRRVPVTRGADELLDFLQVHADRQQAVGTKQAANLKDERIKRGEIDEAERAQEKPSWKQVAGWASRPRSRKPTQEKWLPAIHRQR